MFPIHLRSAAVSLAGGLLLLAPSLWANTARDIDAIPQQQLPAMSAAERDSVQHDARRRQFAVTRPVDWTLADGQWQDDGTDALWQLRISSLQAESQSLRLALPGLPDSARLNVSAPDGSHLHGPYGVDDLNVADELWTALVPGESLLLSLRVAADERDTTTLQVTEVHYGFDAFWAGNGAAFKSGSCNVDVACPQADPFRNQVRAVVRIQISGSFVCSGTLLNNTANDLRPFVLTAAHCLEGTVLVPPTAVAQSVVTYFNYETSSCGGNPDGSLSQSQSGSSLRARWDDTAGSDMALLELNTAPSNAFNAAYAGWDRGSAAPRNVVGIHHPSGDEKRISIDNDATSITSFGGFSSPGDGNYIRIGAWDQGTTEQGSSGSGLFDSQGRVVGQLSGGSASCANRGSSDWYGRFASAWTGGGTSSTRLSNWLDPRNSGATAINGRDRNGTITGGGAGGSNNGGGGAISSGGGGGGAAGFAWLLSLVGVLLLRRRRR